MFRLAPLLTTAVAISDETSLMQGVKPQQVSVKEDKSKSVSNLLETAKTMLKNGATTDVVDFAQATLTEIMDEVLPRITDSHDSDQRLIHATFAGFETALQTLQDGVEQVKIRYEEERELSAQHKLCRGMGNEARAGCTNEYCACETKRECDYDLYAIWTRFVTEEQILRGHSDEIEGHFCLPGANGTTQIFRDQSVVLFEPWLVQKPIVEGVEHEYDVKVEDCKTKYEDMDTKTSDCNALQTQLEQASCTYRNEAQTTQNNFVSFWYQQVNTYQTLVDEVHCLEIDRWKEWRTLTSVQCLLRATTERNGRPCDEQTDEARDEIENCERVQVDTDIDHLRIVYPDEPPRPESCTPNPLVCQDKDTCRCIPVVPHFPCTSEYEAQEYEMLWDPPEPAFHSSNSHCNERQECVDCNPTPASSMCAVYGAHTGPFIVNPRPEDECKTVTRAQMDEGTFDTDDGHFVRQD